MGPNNQSDAVAIIGLGSIFPDAPNVQTFWDNICKGHVAIGDVPKDRWDPALYYDPDHKTPDKTYSCIGGFVRHLQFESKRFRIPPRTLVAIDDVQKMALLAVAEALADAGLEVFEGDNQYQGTLLRPFDRSRTAVIVGNAMGGEAKDLTSLRVWFPRIRESIIHSAHAIGMDDSRLHTLLESLELRFKDSLPNITEDSMPGELSNCITGRISNAFDLRGANYTIDAACAASMAAMQAGYVGLQERYFDMVIVGGADRSLDPPTYVKFSKIGALSPNISAPFDARANGFVMGEGAGMMVLKRLQDAERDGNKIYAVIRAVGSASDGKGKGLTAPNPRGQQTAIIQAYQRAGVPIESVGLFEAHGTSTIVGDATELHVLNELLSQAGMPKQAIPIGSVKSMIGHLKAAAGVAALIKTTLALHHKILPPSANFISPPSDSPLFKGYLAVNTTTRPWDIPEGSNRLRRAGVSAFGFGGTNFHVVLEEYSGASHTTTSAIKPITPAHVQVPATQVQTSMSSHDSITQQVLALFAEKTGYGQDELHINYQLEADLGIDTVKQAEIISILRTRFHIPATASLPLGAVPTIQHMIDYIASYAKTDKPAVSLPQVVMFGADDLQSLQTHAQHTLQQASDLDDAVLARARTEALHANVRLAYVAHSKQEAMDKLAEAAVRKPKLLLAQGIFLNDVKANCDKIAFLFPGQGSQYMGMLKDLAAAYPVVADTFAQADKYLEPMIGARLTDIVWPAVLDEAADLRLRETQNCQPAMLTADVAMLRLLQMHGVQPDMVAGHSLGEYAAAVAAGVLSFEDALYAVSARGREMAGVKVADNGKMAMVAADLARVEEVLQAIDGYVIAANKNCHTQTVIAGATVAVEEAIGRFLAAGIEARQIPVSHAFHCSIVAPASEPLGRVLGGLTINLPKIPLISNVGAAYYPASRDGIAQIMQQQLAAPVEFIAQIERLYADGARVFIEVGPRRAITGFVRNILGTRPHYALSSNHPKKSGVEGVLELFAALSSGGIAVQFGGPQPAGVPAPVVVTTTPAPIQKRTVAAPASRIGIAGIGIALPQTQPFAAVQSDALAGIFRGDNFITPISGNMQQAMLDKHVVRLDKAHGLFQTIATRDDVLQLASQFGTWDLGALFGIDASIVDAFDSSTKLAVAVGLEALRDAGLPLVRRYRETSNQKRLANGYALPQAIAKRTGIIMAAAFPGIDSVLDEATQCHHAQQATNMAQELEYILHALPQTPANASLRADLQQRMDVAKAKAAAYTFNRKWLLRTLPMGHAQLAQCIGAQGPNTQINAACASGTQAIAMACDWIRLGLCDRVVVVTVDDVTTPTSLPWFGAGFLSSGAATVERDVQLAAVPFGANRNGMILGAAACGFVVEDTQHMQARGLQPIVEIVAAKFANSAFHATRLDSPFIQDFLQDLVDDVSAQEHVAPAQLAKDLVFMSHETYTPARGGSSAAEVDALRHVFGAAASDVVIANTKGYSGHPMGATLEDVVAIKGLQRQEMPAVANMHHIDPAFADLRFAKGGHVDAHFALRFAAGFGSQVAAVAYKQVATTEARLVDPMQYAQWLQQHVGSAAGLEVSQRTLRIADKNGQRVEDLQIPSLQCLHAQQSLIAPVNDAIMATLVSLFVTHTGYSVDELNPQHALEEDLGIDTVKQAEIFSIVRKQFNIPDQEGFKLSDLQTLQQICDYITKAVAYVPPIEPPVLVAASVATAPAPASSILDDVLDLFVAATGYAKEDLAVDHRLEEDLGIDTVKQAEIMAQLRTRYQLPTDAAFKLSEVQSIALIVAYIERLKPAEVVAAEVVAHDTHIKQQELSQFDTHAVGLVAVDTAWHEKKYFNLQNQHVVLLGEHGLQGVLRTACAHVEPLAIDAFLNHPPQGIHAVVYIADSKHINAAADMATAVQDSVAVIFKLAQICAQRGLHFLYVTDNANAAGFAKQTPAAWVHGAVGGLQKSLQKEIPALRCLSVDCHERLDATSMQEVLAAWQCSNLQEIVWNNHAWHTIERTRLLHVDTLAQVDNQRPLIVATGGARGVTYALLREMAALAPYDCVLVARTLCLGAREKALLASPVDMQKHMAQEALQAAGKKATPVAVRRFIEHAQAQQIIENNIEALQRLGCSVTLLQGDLSQDDARKYIIHELQKYPTIDVLLHGAGVEESKMLVDKDSAAFVRAFAPKATAAIALLQALKPRKMVSMGSIAGRFGNAGQADYSAANACLAAMAHGGMYGATQMLNINWTAWGQIGMATRGSVQQVLEAAGVALLPLKTGVHIGRQLIRGDITGDVVVAGALGQMAPPASVVDEAPIPAIFGRMERINTHTVSFARIFNPTHDACLQDHRIDGVAVLPGVLGLEMMLQAATWSLGALPAVVKNIRFMRPVKFIKDEALEVHAEVDVQPAETKLTLVTWFTGPSGRKMRREHFYATVNADEANHGMPDIAQPQPLCLGSNIDREAIYQRYFHGHCFQVLEHMQALDDQGADSQIYDKPAPWLKDITHSQFVGAPYLREAGFQTAGLWEMAEFSKMALPSSIDTLYLSAQGPLPAGPYTVQARCVQAFADGRLFDIAIYNADGQLVDCMLGYRTVVLRDLLPHEYFEPVDIAKTMNYALMLHINTVQALLQNKPLWLHYLSAAEQAHLHTLKIKKRRLEWLAVRIAAKRLLRAMFVLYADSMPAYADINIEKDDQGLPYAILLSNPTVIMPAISMSHTETIAAVLLSTDNAHKPGIDVEMVAARDDHFATLFFTEAEHLCIAQASQIPAEKDKLLTQFWSIKEAMLKALGIGAQVDFRDLSISLDNGRWLINLTGAAKGRADMLQAGVASIDVQQYDTYVVVCVLLPVIAPQTLFVADKQVLKGVCMNG